MNIKTKNEIIKKEIALREKNYAAQLKAKKQRLSKPQRKRLQTKISFDSYRFAQVNILL